MTPDLDRIHTGVSAALREAGETILMAHFGQLEPDQIRQKTSPSDLVTEIDVRAEAFFRARFHDLLPDAGFIGEEAAAADPSIVARLAGPGLFWVVDPIDGTRNYVRGTREFGSIIALVKDGQTIAGWLHAAPENRTYACHAGLDAPVIMTTDGEGRTQSVPIMPASRMATHHDGARPSGLRSLGWLDDAWRDRLVARLGEHTETTANHCSAYGYIYLLTGQYDFKVSSRIHPWDHLAGAYLLARLGAQTRFLDTGHAYGPVDSVDRPLLAVAPGQSWDDLAGLLL